MIPAGRALQGILAMVVSQLAFIFNDTLIKLASDELPMGEIIFLRGLFCSLLVGAIATGLGLHRRLAELRSRAVWWRLVGELGGTFIYILALFHMPIANATIIFQAVPLTATAGAAVFLRERVGWRRWTAIVAGFLGVVLVVRPGLAGFDVFGLLVLVSVLFVAFRDIWTQAMPGSVPTLLLTAVTAIAVTAMGALMGLTENWIWPSATAFAQILGAAVFLFGGYFFVIAAMRLGEMSVTAPFRYVAVVFAIAIGFLVWGDTPDLFTVLGTLIIVGAGIYTLHRERLRAAKAAPLAEASSAAPPAA